MTQLALWNEHKCAQRRILAPFEVDATEATAPGYRRIFWRLLSRRIVRWNPLHFEMVLRDEVQHLDISLVRDHNDQLVEKRTQRRAWNRRHEGARHEHSNTGSLSNK